MKSKLEKFVSENFVNIQSTFLKDENNILKEMLEDKVLNNEDFDYLVKCLEEQLNVFTAIELIEAINERSLGVDLNSENECEELLEMLKAITQDKE
jgi:hypothetical protein